MRHGADPSGIAGASPAMTSGESNNENSGRNPMRMVLTLMATLAAAPALAQSTEPIQLRDLGSFHIGGRHIEVRGQPVKEIVFTPGGVPAKVDPNGVYQV